MPFVFYDTETTGTDKSFDQIHQFAAVRTNVELEVENPDRDVINIRCRRLPHVVPSPGALTVTRVDPTSLDAENLSHYEMAQELAARLSEWSPAAFVGYNNIDFDERLLRQAFYQTLLPIYLTNKNNNYRADIMRMVQAAAVYAPDGIVVPVNAHGRRVFKLGEVARANGITLGEEQAHDALNDVRATLELARLVKRDVPAVWNHMMLNAVKSAVENFVDQEEIFHLTNVFPQGPYSEVVTMAGRNPNDPNEVALFSLGYAPEDYLDLGVDGLLDVFSQSPKRIRTIRTNAQPIVMPFSMPPDAVKGPSLDEATYRARAQAIRENSAFQDRVGEALTQRYAGKEPSPYVEKQIYDGFFDGDDTERCARFHKVPWPARVELCDQFSDLRLRELGKRLIYLEQPDALSPADRAYWRQWETYRLTTEEDVPWTSIPKALLELGDMRRRAIPEATAQLQAIETYLVDLGRRHGDG